MDNSWLPSEEVPEPLWDQANEPALSCGLSTNRREVWVRIHPLRLTYPLQREHILTQLDAQGYGDYAIDMDAIRTVLDRSRRERGPFSLRIGRRQEARMQVTVSSDGIKAWLTLHPARGFAQPTAADIVRFLNQQGIFYGIISDVLHQAAAEGRLERTLIAEGTPAQKGENAWFEYLIDEQDLPAPRLREDGSVDFRELNLISTVEPNTPLMRKHPAKPGIPGRKVSGEEIPAPPGRDYRLVESLGSVVGAEDPQVLLSARAGRPVRLNRSVKVDDVITIQEVGPHTGHVDFRGSVIVIENIARGYRVKASGDIIVYGVVEEAILEAQGNIDVRGSIYGGEQGRLKAGGNIRLQFAQNLRLECMGDLFIQEGLFHCDTRVMGSVYAGTDGGRGQINGGQLWGSSYLEVGSLGSRSATTTLVSLGQNPYLREQLKELDVHLVTCKQRLDQLLKSLIYLRTHPSPRQEDLHALEEQRSEHLEMLNSLTEQQRTLRENLEMSLASCEVVISQRLYSGARIMLADQMYEAEQEYGPSRVRLMQMDDHCTVVREPLFLRRSQAA